VPNIKKKKSRWVGSISGSGSGQSSDPSGSSTLVIDEVNKITLMVLNAGIKIVSGIITWV
jgi:hypothetical protein